jgi:DNA-directed RNA polymerase specialized sigma24 family protein
MGDPGGADSDVSGLSSSRNEAEIVPNSNSSSQNAGFFTKDDQQAYQHSLSSLPADQQNVIQLRVEESLPFEEIGLRMKCSADAAQKLYLRAIMRLQKLVDTSHDPEQGKH